MEVSDWIIYYNEARGRYTCVEEGSPSADIIGYKMKKVVHGTRAQAMREAKKIELADGITGIFHNNYTYK